MPLLQPGSRSPRWQARNARVTADFALDEAGDASGSAGGAVEAAATAIAQAGIAKAAADTAVEAAGTATEAAQTATSQVTQVFTFQQVRDSYADPDILTATTTDGVSLIAIAAHQRHYLNNPAAPAVNAGQVGALAPSTAYHVFYDDPTFAGGAVAYQVATAIEGALASLEHPARHYVGQVSTPAAGAAATEGNAGGGLPYWKREQLGIDDGSTA